MKKILFFLLLSSFGFGQISQDDAQNIAKTFFEKEYVQQTFKDPYSYELKKIWSEPITRGSSLQNKISQLDTMVNSPSFTKKQKKEFTETLAKRKAELGTLCASEKEIVMAYVVYFDTYGANSLGNKVLGKYTITIDIKGKIVSEVAKL